MDDATNIGAGPFYLTTDAEVATFAANNYDAVVDGLYIGPNVSTLAGLTSLRYVSVALDIYQAGITSLQGLENLSRIDGYLSLAQCPALVDISALDSLVFAEDIYFWNNGLTSMDDAFGCLGTTGYLSIEEYNLLSMTGFAPVATSVDYVDVSFNPLLADVSNAFPMMTSTGTIRMRANDVLTSLGGAFPALTTCLNNIEISDNALTSLDDAFPALVTAGGNLSVVDEVNLLSMAQFASSATSAGGVYLQNLYALNDTTDALSSLITISNALYFSNCGSLVELDGAFSDLQSGGPVSLINLTSLNNTAGSFSALTTLNGSLYIYNCSSLQTFGGAFDVLETVGGGTITIENCTSLPSLGGAFDVLETGGAVYIQNTGITSLANAFPALLALTGNFTVSNNLVLTSMADCASSMTQSYDAYVYNCPLLTNVQDAFSSLVTASGAVGIDTCATLTSLNGAFASVQTAKYAYLIDNNLLDLTSCFPSLVSVEVNIFVFNRNGATGVSMDNAFPALTSMTSTSTNTIDIRGPNIASMAGAFPLLATMAGTSGTSNQNLLIRSVATVGASFASLNTTLNVSFIDMRSSAQIDGFASLVTAKQLSFAGSIGSITGFQALTSCTSGLFLDGITGTPALNLSGSFPLLASLPGTAGQLTLSIRDNTRPVLMAGGFPSLTSTNRVTISGNTGAGTSFQNAFPALTSITSTFASTTQLTISTNSGLTTLQGAFAVLTGTPSFKAVISSNSNLTTVSGSFAVLSNGTSFSVTNNVQLPTTAQVAALFAVLTGNGFPGTLTNSGNGPG